MKHIKTFERLIKASDPIAINNILRPISDKLENIIKEIKKIDNFQNCKVVNKFRDNHNITIDYTERVKNLDIMLLKIEIVLDGEKFFLDIEVNNISNKSTNSTLFLEFFENKFRNKIYRKPILLPKFSRYFGFEFNINEIDNIIEEITLEKYYLYVATRKYNL